MCSCVLHEWIHSPHGCNWCLNKGMKINNRYCFLNCVLDKFSTMESFQDAYNELGQSNDPDLVVDGIKDKSSLIVCNIGIS